MPKQVMNYQNNIIYKIQHKSIDELIYIGSTTNFAKRKYKHKTACNNENNTEYKTKKYVMIRENGGWDMFDMVLVKKYPCNDYLEARQEEERIRREMNANMNTNRCFATQEEHIEYHKIHSKKYYETHKQEIKESGKQYHETHKEEISERKKIYYETHKQTIHVKNKEKLECECGCIVTQKNLSTHKKTTKHIKLLSAKLLK
jgi:hypothetical protein